MPTRMPVVKGMPSSPAGVERGQAALGRLVRGALVAVEVGVERLDHHPLGRRHHAGPPARRGTERRRWREGGDRSPARRGGTWRRGSRRSKRSRARPATRGGGIALLGPLAEGEQRLVAAGLGAGRAMASTWSGMGYGELDAGGGLGERAVPAPVAAQLGEGDEDLRRERDPGAVVAVADRGRLSPCKSAGGGQRARRSPWRRTLPATSGSVIPTGARRIGLRRGSHAPRPLGPDPGHTGAGVKRRSSSDDSRSSHPGG